MTLDAIDFSLLYRQQQALAARTRKTASAWDARAPAMTQRALGSRYAQEFVARMKLQGARSLLDVGCGPGTIGLLLAPQLQQVIGLDYSAGMLEQLRAQAAAQGLRHVQALQLAWEDDWSAVPQCDIVVASRSTAVADIAQALRKLDEKARQRVYLTHLVGGHFIDRAIEDAIGRHQPAQPDYIYLLNILHRMGIHPELSYLTQESRLAGAPDFAEFARRVAWSLGELSVVETTRLHAWYERASPQQRAGAPMRWALISWEKTPC